MNSSLLLSTITLSFSLIWIACSSENKDAQDASTMPRKEAMMKSPDEAQGKTVEGESRAKDTPKDETSVASDLESLQAFARSGDYRTWDNTGKEPMASTRAHASFVRVFFNGPLSESMKEGRDQHPKGSVVVKEIFDSTGRTLTAYAIDVKVKDGQGPENWVFYEGFVSQALEGTYIKGSGFCSSCHSQGRDFVVSKLP